MILIRRLAKAHFEVTGEHVYVGRDASGAHTFTVMGVPGVKIREDHDALLHMLMILSRGVADHVDAELRDYGS